MTSLDPRAFTRPTPVRPQRAEGTAVVAVAHSLGRTRVARLSTSGSVRVLPVAGPGPAAMDLLGLNTAGGMTGGDRLDVTLDVRQGAWLRWTTPGAERAYRADAPGDAAPGGDAPRAARPAPLAGYGTARARATLTVAAGARLHWLPQETILYDGARLDRRLRVDLAADATLLLVEAVVLGRAAMGETMRHGAFHDARNVWRDGRLVHADRVRIGPGDWDALGSPATLFGARAFATVLLAGPGAEAALDPVRDALPPGAGASLVRDGVLLIRLLAPDGLTLRRRLIPLVEQLGRAPLPVSWTL